MNVPINMAATTDQQIKLDKWLEDKNVTIEARNITNWSEEAFIDIRHKGFGASDSSKLLGVNPYVSRDQLIREKITKYHDETIGQKAVVRMGRDLEDYVLYEIQCRLHVDIFKPCHMYGKMRYGLMTNFDGVIEISDRFYPAEVKIVSFFGDRNYNYTDAVDMEEYPDYVFMMESRNDLQSDNIPDDFEPDRPFIERYVMWQASLVGIPAYYYTQVQQQIDFLGVDEGWLFAKSTKEWKLFGFRMRKDPTTINALKANALKAYQEINPNREVLTEQGQEEDDDEI